MKTGKTSSAEDREFADAMADFRQMTFGQMEVEADPFHDAYWSFQNFVEDYFSGREDDFLSFPETGILKTEGYERLCRFLECPCGRKLRFLAVINTAFHHGKRFSKLFRWSIISKTGILPAEPVLRK